MEKYQMNGTGCRANYYNCSSHCMQTRRNRDAGIPEFPPQMQEPSCGCRENMYHHVDQMPPAMAYVPYQRMTDTFDLCYALKVGTVFPQLCKPFCGRRCR